MKSKPKTPNQYTLAHVREMRGYIPGMQPTEPGWVKLNTNENPYPPSPKVISALRSLLDGNGNVFRLYPDPRSGQLRRAVAKHHGLQEDQVIVGNGCDDILNLLMRAFCDAEHLAGMMEPSYTLYSVLSAVQSSSIRRVLFNREMDLNIDEIVASGSNIFFLTNPNAPTGVHFEPEKIAELAAAYSGILVIDETYAPFAQSNCVGLLNRFPNLVITRSFSKVYSLAGMRVGYGLASAEVIDILDRVRDSYNLDGFAQVAATTAIEDEDYYNHTITESNRLREQYREVFEQYGWFVYPSEANFLFVEPLDTNERASAELTEGLFNFLLSEKILVRYFPKHALTRTFLRISVGDAQEMDQLFEVIEKWRIKNNV